MKSGISDLELAFILADIADNLTLKFWSPHGMELMERMVIFLVYRIGGH